MSTTAETLRELLTLAAGIPGELVELDSEFDGVLAMDSLSFVAFQVEVERTFGIDCPLEELREVARFRDVVELVERKLVAEAAR
ncbi:MAG: acyl carrier protein [Actinomycetota bacterium]|nr:acyl carrier protein [Actinomycetota bacterium]